MSQHTDNKYGFFIKYEIKSVEFKFGFKHQGIFAAENIKKGQLINRCDPSICNYYVHKEREKILTKEEVEDLCKKYPESEYYIKHYSYMAGHDAFDFPKDYKERKITDNCLFINHSCDGNCGFWPEDCGIMVARRDIECGEELTYDYQLMDTEASFYAGMVCKCGSHNCRGILNFDYHRNFDWLNENYNYCGYHVHQCIDDLKTKWYSSKCYIKRYNNKTELGLTALKKISKDELVAKFSDIKNITKEAHFIRHNDNPTCYLNDKGEVYARHDIEPSTELTLNFN